MSKESKDEKQLKKQESALKEFKTRVKDHLKPEQDDFYLQKWLKARKFDVPDAEKMFLKHMKLREKMRIDKILEEYEPPEVIKKYMPSGFVGFDKEGSPVVVELYGKLDMKGIMNSVKISDLEKVKIQNCENIVMEWKRQTEKLGRRVDGIIAILDFEGIGPRSLWTPGIQMYMHLVQLLEDNYPEMLKKLFIVNAPAIFPVLFKFIKPLITEDMREKINVFGGNYQSALLEYISHDQLPAFLGGTQTDSDGNPRCTEKICQGGIVPKEYYISETAYLDHMNSRTVENGGKLLIQQEVKTPGSTLCWEFKTVDYDIHFGLLIKRNDDYEKIIPVTKISSQNMLQDGHYVCKEPGTYFLCFDNSYSWFREKKIYYSLIVKQPDVYDVEEKSKKPENWETAKTDFKTADL